MHIPDGMLKARTWIPAWLSSAGVLAYAIRRVCQTLTDGGIVVMAVSWPHSSSPRSLRSPAAPPPGTIRV
ncbi:MAG: energy-coupling factor ABC transporter permease [Coriobacteriia bacterium]|nr:energy-coupling factor ABC transporter permease [Coriobacteriia bacterium]